MNMKNKWTVEETVGYDDVLHQKKQESFNSPTLPYHGKVEHISTYV